jgi:DnaJ-class molecular chaperone
MSDLASCRCKGKGTNFVHLNMDRGSLWAHVPCAQCFAEGRISEEEMKAAAGRIQAEMDALGYPPARKRMCSRR